MLKIYPNDSRAKGTKTGTHDNTALSMDADEDTMPPPPKKLSLRQRITEVYEKRVAETKAVKPGGTTRVTPGEQLEITQYTEHVETPSDPLEDPVKIDDAPTTTTTSDITGIEQASPTGGDSSSSSSEGSSCNEGDTSSNSSTGGDE